MRDIDFEDLHFYVFLKTKIVVLPNRYGGSRSAHYMLIVPICAKCAHYLLMGIEKGDFDFRPLRNGGNYFSEFLTLKAL